MAVNENNINYIVAGENPTPEVLNRATKNLVPLVDSEVEQAKVDANEYTDTKIQSTETSISDSLDTKVDKISGKQLSTEDYTTAEKNKLGEVGSMANRNVTISSANPSGGVEGDIWFQID